MVPMTRIADFARYLKRLKASRRAVTLAARTAVGAFIGVFLLIILQLHLSGTWASQLREGAMRFVPADAASFFYTPDVDQFMREAAPSIISIYSALMDPDDFTPDLISLFVYSDSTTGQKLPPPCRTLQHPADLSDAGIDPNSSLSLMYLDNSIRAAIKFSNESVGLGFLADVLTPLYLQVQSTAKGPANKDSPRKFRIEVEADNVEICVDPDRHKIRSHRDTFELEINKKHSGKRTLPLRLPAIDSGPTRIKVTCQEIVEGGDALPCSCELVQVGKKVDPTTAKKNICGTAVDLASYRSIVHNWQSDLDAGKTIKIGDAYVAKIAGFHVVEQWPKAKPALNYLVHEPPTPIVHDDSFLVHFLQFKNNGKNFKTTIFGGYRPDSLIVFRDLERREIPLYLMTPIGLHFAKGTIVYEAAANVEPQDLTVVQDFSRHEGNIPITWKDWPAGLGLTFGDYSLKQYARFARVSYPTVEPLVTNVLPLVPVILDLMENGVPSLSATILQENKDTFSWRAAIAVPNVTPVGADQLVHFMRNRAIMRQAEWALQSAAGQLIKLRQNISGEDFNDRILERTCPQSYWKLKTGARFNEDGTINRNFIDIIDNAIGDRRSWRYTFNNRTLLRLGPVDDPNVVVWGQAFSSNSLVAKRIIELKKKLSAFTDDLNNAAKSVRALHSLEQIRDQLRSSVPRLIKKASEMEAEGASAKEEDLSSRLRDISKLDDPREARFRLIDLQMSLPTDFATQKATLNVQEIQSLCQAKSGKSNPTAVADYDTNANALRVVDTGPDIDLSIKKETASLNGSGEKIRLDIDSSKIPSWLKILPTEYEKKLNAFPFPNIQVQFSGRPQSGVGVRVRMLAPDVKP